MDKQSQRTAANDNCYLEAGMPFSATGAAGLSELLSEHASWNGEFLNRLEAGSVATLIAFTADSERTTEDVIQKMVASRFNVDRITQIRRVDYNDVVRFLVNLGIKATIN